MSQHGCPERLSNRSKGFQEDGPSQPTMELMVETLTGTAFEMTVSPSDTIFAIKSKIFRVEGIPVSQQHLLYNLRELDDAMSLREHAIGDGARLRLVLGLRGGPMATRRLPPPEPWRDIERLLHPHRVSSEWGGSDCKVTVLVFREGERVNMVRVRENRDGSYSPLDHANLGGGEASLRSLLGEAGEEVRRDNALTAGKMMELRRRMEALSLARRRPQRTGEKRDIQKTRSEETLSVPSLLDEQDAEHSFGRERAFGDRSEPFGERSEAFGERSDTFGSRVYCGETLFDFDRYTLLPPIGTRSDPPEEKLKLSDALAGSILVKARDGQEEGAILEECLDAEEYIQDSLANNLTPVPTAEYSGVGVGSAEGGAGVGGWRAFGSSSQLAPPPLAHALFSSSTSDLEALRRNRILPALSRHRNREHLHLSDEGLDMPREPPRSRAVGCERRRRQATHEPPTQATPPHTPLAEKSVPLAQTAPLVQTTPTQTPVPLVHTPVPLAQATPPDKKLRLRCVFCRKRLSIATVHLCRCGSQFCAPHRYAEVHGCAYDYKRPLPPPQRLPRI